MNSRIKEILEALIFISVEPLTLEKIKSVMEEFEGSDVEAGLQELVQSCAAGERGIQISQAGGGYYFSTKPDNDQWVRRLLKIERRSKLSPASLEVLSIVAYHQPITLAEISAIRGVDSVSSLKTLLQKKLVKIVGRKKAPGNPLIYRTSDHFLTYFGLNDIKDLPSVEEIAKLLEEDRENEL
jgi:segregation and condensation protein B